MDDHHILVFEFMANGDLKHFLKKKSRGGRPVTMNVKQEYAKDIADGMT